METTHAPNLKGMTLFMGVLRVLLFIKGILLLMAGMVLHTTGSILSAITENSDKTIKLDEKCEQALAASLSAFPILIGILCILFALTLFLAAWLCKRVIIRNRYIEGMEGKLK